MSLHLPNAVPLGFMSFGFSEILLVGVVALLVFGGNLPDVMRQLGRSYGRLRQSLHEFSRPVRDELREVKRMPPRTETPRESLPQEGPGDTADEEAPPEYPDYGEPPEPESASTTERPAERGSETKAPRAADEPPPV